MINNNTVEPMAIDLMWLRPGKVGGTESYIRNLLDGFLTLEDDFRFVLLVSQDNADTFSHYEKDKRFSLLEAPIGSYNIAKRIIWQNINQNRFLRKHGLRRCFVPVYCKPWLNGGIEYTCVIHDLLMMHYPKNHPFHEVAYTKLCWWMDVKNAHKIITISNWVKKDIIKHYHRDDIEVIYNPITIDKGDTCDFSVLSNRYAVSKKEYFYTIAQLIPHKNLDTLIRMMDVICKENPELPNKLLVTGVNGNAEEKLRRHISVLGLEKKVILTGFLSNTERNTLYKYAHSFLFPSVFEGFGMPPIEAMLFGVNVITTKCTCIPEVTQNAVTYVENPYDEREWIEKIKNISCSGMIDFERYDKNRISKIYFEKLMKD